MSNYIEISSDLQFLIVDEAPTFREALSSALRTLGYKKVLGASDAIVALEMLKTEPVGFIICERNLRQTSGMEILKEIRENPEFQRVPFMMMGSEFQKEDVLLGAEFGIDGFLKKPFVLKDVTTRISACMQRYQDPSSNEAVYEEAREFFMKGNYKKAIETYKRILAGSPSSARVRVGLARCYRALEQLDEAETLLKEAIQVNPMYVHAFHELGLVHLQKDQIDAALASFDSAIQLSPSNPIRYETLAEILMRRKCFGEAEGYLMRAVKLELAYPVLFAQLGKALFSQRKLDKAAKFFEKALQKEPDNTSYLNSMGICMKEAGRFDESLGYYNQALKYRPKDIKILFNKVLCLMGMTEYDRARKTLMQILKIDPDYEKARLKLTEIEKIERMSKGGAA